MWIKQSFFGVLTKQFVNEVIEKMAEKDPIRMDSFRMPTFQGPSSMIGKLNCSDPKVLIHLDGLPWYQKKKRLPVIKPRKYIMELEDRSVVVYNCCSANCDFFKKFVIIVDNLGYLIYVSNKKFDEYDEIFSKKKTKINGETAEAVRLALDGRTVMAASRFLAEKDINVTDLQIRNQARNVNTTVKMKRGPRPVTIPSELAELSRIHSSSSFFCDGSNYRFVYVDMDMLSIYIHGLPSKRHIMKYRNQFSDMDEWSTDRFNEYLVSSEDHFVSGIDIRVCGQIMVDTTFDLTSAYVTFISADFSNFRTKPSQKIRHCLIAFMVHNSKESTHHREFAAKVSEKMELIDPKRQKRIPSMLHDGESSFKEYLTMSLMSDAIPLRCDLHRKSNMERALNLNEKDAKRVFGKMENGMMMKRGIFNSFSESEFTRKLEKSKINEDIKEWIRKRQKSLFETHSLRSKLLAGVAVQYATSNKIECLNNKMKNIIQRPESGSKCAEIIMNFLNDEKTAIVRSATHGDSRTVEFTGFQDCEDMSLEKKANYLSGIGIQNVFTVLYDIPKQLCEVLSPNFVELQKLTGYVVSDKSILVTKSAQNNTYVSVETNSETMKCSNHCCVNKLPKLCIHVGFALTLLEAPIRKTYLDKLVNVVASYSVCRNERSKESGKQGRRFRRKYQNKSKTNHCRTIKGAVSSELDSTMEHSVLENSWVFDPPERRPSPFSDGFSIENSQEVQFESSIENSMITDGISTILDTSQRTSSDIPRKRFDFWPKSKKCHRKNEETASSIEGVTFSDVDSHETLGDCTIQDVRITDSSERSSPPFSSTPKSRDSSSIEKKSSIGISMITDTSHTRSLRRNRGVPRLRFDDSEIPPIKKKFHRKNEETASSIEGTTISDADSHATIGDYSVDLIRTIPVALQKRPSRTTRGVPRKRFDETDFNS